MPFTQTNAGDLLSVHARYAAHAAAGLGYGFRSLDGADGYLFEVSDGARKALFACGAGSPYALNDARAASLARDKAFCAAALREAGLAAAPGDMFFVTPRWNEMRSPGREPDDARAYIRRSTLPVFCKPISASNGLYAEVIENQAEFDDYLARVSREHFAILIQPYLVGAEHRVFVLEGRVLFSYEKQLPHVIGDGRTPLAALIERIPRDTQTPPRARDEHGAHAALDSVPAPGARLVLEGPANRAAGGASVRLADGAPGPLAKLALASAEAIGLRLAAVDVFDLSPARDLSELCVIEVNSNPMIKTLEDHGRWDLIDTIWRANFAASLK